jgi:hypothetical protein
MGGTSTMKGEMRNEYKMPVRKRDGKENTGGLRSRWEHWL